MSVNPARVPARAPILTTILALIAAACSSVTYTSDYDRSAPVAASATWSWRAPADGREQALDAISPFLERRIERAVAREMDAKGFTRADSGKADYYVTAYPILPDRSRRNAAADGRRGSRVSVGVGVGFGRPYPYSPYGLYGPYGRYGAWGWPYGGWPYGAWHPYAWYLGLGWSPAYGYDPAAWGPAYPYTWRSWGGWAGRPAPMPGVGARSPGTLVIEVLDASTGQVAWEGRAEGALLDMPSGEAGDRMERYVDGIVARILRDFPPGS